ncbi:MAG TPA: hypothetical protein VEB68_06190 [Croceibacterium sp.]|nr:hypothetical protein [Croceibacterium sp.]
MTSTSERKPRNSDRRGGDRRQAAVPFPGSERRAAERRSGRDRRDEPRG